MANISTSGLLTDAQLAASASVDGALFIPAITTIATRLMVHDPRYVQCVMNSGLFQFVGDFDVFAAFRGVDANGNGSDSVVRGRQDSASFGAAATLIGIDPNVQLGSCRLACGGSPNYISQAHCCAAAARFRDTCKLAPSAQAYRNYTATLNTMLGLKSDCTAVSAPTVSLWVVASLLVLALTMLVVLTRRLLRSHRRSQSPDDANEMERASSSGVALAPTPTTSRSRYEKLLLSWQQVANLVWKNVCIKRATPVAFAMEILLPLILTSGLVVIANIDDIIWGTGPWPDDGTVERATAQVTTPASGFLCTNFNADTGDTLGVPSGTKRTFYANGQTVVGLFLLIVYIKFVSRTTAMMVMEKEARLREIMKIMGLSDRAVIMSWLLTTAVTATPLSFAMAALLKYTKVFPHGSYIVLVWLFFLLSMAITAFAYFLTPLFRKSRAASIASVLAWIVLYFPYFAVQAKGNAVKYAAALAPPTALGLAIDALLRHAQLGTGMAYDMAIAKRPVTVPTPLAMCGMLVVDIVLLLLLGWYLDQVVPQEHGVTRKWNFLFTKAYWVVKRSVQTSSDYADLSTPTAAAQDRPVERPADANGPVVEPVTAALAAQERNGTCLQIRDLSKVFHTEDTDRVAVDALSLTMYSGQITALLGHNGAGKTTTIAMLTGLTPPTSGDAVLFGRSIRTDFDELRQIMGICPQHDVLLGELSVQDHLRFFGTMKHVSPHLLEDEVEKMIQEVGLTEKRKVASKNLSGGQKRKLSVALAFIGGSKLVFLDEPTSGMDPYSRRFTWNLLQRNREDRVTVLTTHFMDEADILGDRIAILADGQLRCAGSSLFLKNRFGAGYNLTVIKASAACAVQPVAALLQQFVATATCLSHHGAEMVFQLPADTVESFPRMLEALDAEMTNLQIAQYGVSVTTLEEVFLRISRDRDEESKPLRSVSSKRFAPAFFYECGNASLTSQISAMVTKRFRITRRDRKSLLNAIAIPVLLLVIATVIPEIQVSSFLTDFANAAPSKTMESSCSIQPSAIDFPPFLCARRYDYCHMGIFRCDPQVCCTASNHASPYFPCNNCKTPNKACYNPTCLSPMGAKAQVTVNSFLKATIVALAFAFVPAAIVAFIVREKNEIQNAKILQLICGAKPVAYWVANWIHDSLLLLVPLGVAAIMVLTTSRGLSSPTAHEVFALLILLVAHALAVVPMAYVVSHRYAKHSSAQTALLVFGFVTGGALSIISFLCRMMDIRLSGNSNGNGLLLSTLNRSYLHWIYLLFPGYALNSGVYEIAMHRVSHSSILSDADTPTVAPSFFGLFPWLGSGDCSQECWDRPGAGCCVRSVFALDVAGAPILYALLEALLFALLLFGIEKNSVKWSRDSAPHAEQEDDEEDSDVTAERRRVATIVDPASPSGDAVVLRNVRQQYKGGKVALHDLSLGIPKGECFGYLGINGAGKSTTMKILTGQIAPSSGFASLGGYDLALYRDQARTVLGYCPQFDSLHDLLTVEEQLELYARLKGIPVEHIGDAVNQKILELGLHEYRTKLTRGLSGGNKRKVSTAIALLGAPRIIFLDEPSTGVDPSSRRKMWDVIASVCAEKDSCVVLTTHSMEECEALATRVGILVSGKLQCLGSVEHLKQKFGKGFTVEVKLRAPSDDAVAAIAARVLSVVGEQGHVTLENLQEVCTALGDVDRYELIQAGDASAVVLTQLLRADKLVPVTTFCEWWAAEDMGARLVEFFESSFAGSDVVEQQGGDHFRFQVPKQDNLLRPSTIFRKLEDAKATLAIGEYSVSDTTLEHIFNTMAAQQEEEQLGESEVSKEPAVGRTASTRVSTRGRRRRPTYRRASSSLSMT